MSERYLLKLYVTGRSPRSQRAIANLQKLCEEEQLNGAEMFIIDVLEQPQLAEEEHILMTPTLIKELPLPVQRIIGDLSDRKTVLFGLNVMANQQKY
ncbi:MULTISPECIES: circadian clock KaiB family protein [unclassified Coleofasciculus]|uniref:circadian clock KaiB family protein n=1 Tax=unclassified Coleofasciculus TaxID=2692782 RepID=UPI0018812843|nr:MULTISPECIES: circadian clock KaiB family protein [unclassified Coleofasciculus]MBE9130094.1 circadian clock KaiB family protein [Coleofasciculus sp. LEGE 07081]MBE9152445.1 circadian clock KaiB family protein [Coleofasciculus sp. LEGE 07092]